MLHVSPSPSPAPAPNNTPSDHTFQLPRLVKQIGPRNLSSRFNTPRGPEKVDQVTSFLRDPDRQCLFAVPLCCAATGEGRCWIFDFWVWDGFVDGSGCSRLIGFWGLQCEVGLRGVGIRFKNYGLVFWCVEIWGDVKFVVLEGFVCTTAEKRWRSGTEC